jgi:hypothetical protein
MKSCVIALSLLAVSALSAEAAGGLADGRYNCFVFLSTSAPHPSKDADP